jgi:hypothetical protein
MKSLGNLTGLFQHALPLGSSFQCLLLGSHRTVSWIKTWENARSGPSEILKELAKERGAYLRSLSQGAHPSWSSVRTFRLILSYSEPSSTAQSMEEILALREQLLTTLKGWGSLLKSGKLKIC